MGADRSAATALPLIYLIDELLTASDVARPEVAAALERLATSTSREVRQRMTNGLAGVWSQGCLGRDAQEDAHATVMVVYREWLLSAGIGPWNGFKRPRMRLSEPLAEALMHPDRAFDLPTAADALSGLTAAANCDCEHGGAARATLATLVKHDLQAWPVEWARGYYSGVGAWRGALDSWVATQILAGDDALLEQYLDGFATVPEQLRGLLVDLAEQAQSPEMGERLFAIWPVVMDRLLPGGRHVPAPSEDRASRSNEADLDRSLSPKRPKDAQWPLQEWVRVLVRWIDAFAARPCLADHLMKCLGLYGQVASADGVGLILRLLGTDAPLILSDSQYVTHWLRIVLVERTDGLEVHRPALRQLLDDLAAQGSPNATKIQRELEA